MDRPLVRFDRPGMGGILSITLPDGGGRIAGGAGTTATPDPSAAAGAAFEEVARIDRAISLFDPSGDLFRLNLAASGGAVRPDRRGRGRSFAVDPVLYDLLEAGVRLARRTGGAFDPTVGPLMRLWGFRGGPGAPGADPRRHEPPTEGEIARTLRRVGARHVLLDPAGRTVGFRRAGIEIDLGAIGKGLAVDQAVRALRARGVSSALVSFGSVAFALGSPPGRPAWSVAVQDPRRPNGILGLLPLRDRAVSSSGVGRQQRRFGRVAVPHVIDPRTGRPAGRAVGASVLHPSATEADAVSTALLVLGPAAGMRLAADTPGLEAMISSAGDGGRTERVATAGWEMVLDDWRGMSRRRFVKAVGLVFGALALTGGPGVAAIAGRAEEALRLLFPGADAIVPADRRLNETEMRGAQRAAGRRFRDDTYLFFTVSGAARPLGRAVVLDVRGRERPITFLVAVDPEGAVAGVEVLAYREAIGGEIRSRRFREQFRGRTIGAPLRLGEDFQGITGATLSSRATGYAVRKGLALVGALYGAGSGGAGGGEEESAGEGGRTDGTRVADEDGREE